MSEPTKLECALDELLAGKSTEEIVGPEGLLQQLTKALIERAMNAEMSHHLGYQKHAPEGRGSGNNRNGKAASGCRETSAQWRSKCHATGMGPSSPRSFLNTNAASLVSMRRFCRCTRAA